jgi:hypothetical protein
MRSYEQLIEVRNSSYDKAVSDNTVGKDILSDRNVEGKSWMGDRSWIRDRAVAIFATYI